ncbi:MAG TPA: GGDEF domain-containing protein [Zoogloea sp.]|uniref:GGDEF domain-containing protein n=1 Tax=Zoogloea sp. TaxID=49181 RepID=UPI002C669905|nr:GGDEF domain-containing protein [Zoogloea sp.]HMV18045.1 GGDEF domain-containing protein [Rhodocyclaceae bacterium]HMV64568.1 GGDEF domain-containing protein [Rhodocyclaceae bacterium]HMW51904.1 GGDEF domain-containing protein [Rhodocyclaceae bacterium]HMY49768.1 GGDEF domain-containing protein [Rhodocyclaceae bacterium]HMZ76123.1 GGDEF domain-containing protein [Rhodocyclaceae bacterium]
MIHILKHVESITQQRDRPLLELGVASALFEVVRAREVNLFKVIYGQGMPRVERVTHVGQDGVRYVDTDFVDTIETEVIDARAEMAACVMDRQIVRRHDLDRGVYVHCFPVDVDRRVLGVLELVTPHVLDDEQMGTAEGFLGLYRNYLNILDYSERDTLTGMLNRKTFDDNLGKLLAGLTPSGGNGSSLPARRAVECGRHWLAVIDVDHFKRINDHYGHLYGDEVLLLLARIMQQSFRHQDKLFRFGGEEFVVVLRSSGPGETATALERFRTAVDTHVFPQIGHVTVSIGYTPIRANDTIPDIVGRADEALYFAKDHGRNQTVSHDDLLAKGLIAPRERPQGDVELF